MDRPGNPFLVTLVTAASVAAVVAFILASLAAGGPDSVGAPTGRELADAAELFAHIAVAATVGALVLAGVRWRPSRGAERAPDARGDQPGD